MTHGRFLTVFLVPNGLESARLGVAATKRLGNAVVRNRAKRLAREVFRRHPVPSGFDVVIVPRPELLHARFHSLEADFVTAVARPGSPRTQSRANRPRGGGRHRRR
jgi:ribonuclease P protein component